MMLVVFSGLNYSYSCEAETGHYLLFDNDHKTHAYLQGKDARIFRKHIKRIGSLKAPEHTTVLLTENAVSIYLQREKTHPGNLKNGGRSQPSG